MPFFWQAGSIHLQTKVWPQNLKAKTAIVQRSQFVEHAIVNKTEFPGFPNHGKLDLYQRVNLWHLSQDNA